MISTKNNKKIGKTIKSVKLQCKLTKEQLEKKENWKDEDFNAYNFANKVEKIIAEFERR